jgi:DNA-binding CsgD family transcriptional regulator
VTTTERAIVVFGDVTDSRRSSAEAADWLRSIVRELDGAVGERRRAPFGFTQGDELQGLLEPDADPFAVIVRAGLDPGARAMRWAIVAGEVEVGIGPATQRTGPAFLAARDLIEAARAERTGVRAVTGDAESDAILAGVAPLLVVLLDDLTDRQRELARTMLVDGLRQSDAAERLGIRRPTVSVLAERARVREIAALAASLAVLYRMGLERASAGGSAP